MNVFNALGTICDLISGFLIARYLENDMKKEISAEIKSTRQEQIDEKNKRYYGILPKN